MSQTYPDPPASSPLLQGALADGKIDNRLMSILWWKWLHGLLSLVNRLSTGLNVSGTIPLAAVTVGGTVGSLTLVDGHVTKFTAPT